jgi:hypothetical protein
MTFSSVAPPFLNFLEYCLSRIGDRIFGAWVLIGVPLSIGCGNTVVRVW